MLRRSKIQLEKMQSYITCIPQFVADRYVLAILE